MLISDLYNKDIRDAVQSVVVEKGKTKDGKDYDYFDITFKNGWVKRVFLTSDAIFGLLNAVEVVKQSRQDDHDSAQSKNLSSPF